MSGNEIEIYFRPVPEPDSEKEFVKKVKDGVKKESKKGKGIIVDIHGNAILDDAKKELEELEKPKEKEIFINLDTDDAESALDSINSSINNIGQRASSLQGIRDQFRGMQGQALTLDNALKITSGSFNIIGKMNFGQLPSQFKSVSNNIKASHTATKAFGNELKSALNQTKLQGFTSGLSAIPNVFKAAGTAAKGFGVALKSALGAVQLIISGIQAVKEAYERLYVIFG